MKRITAHEQVILDEVDAEIRHVESQKEGAAQDAAAGEDQRGPAEEVAAVPEVRRRTFWEWLQDFTGW